MPYSLSPLPYAYDALSVAISPDVMRLHHDMHHQAYVDKLNSALSSYDKVKDMDLDTLIASIDVLPIDIRLAVQNNGGGHYNHQLFWEIMSPNGGGQPTGTLGSDIDAKYGNFQSFVDQFNAAALGLFGSGWVWLTNELDITPMPNQDNPLMQGQSAPLMGLDVWEHAYYLDYKNRRDEYIRKWWEVVDWTIVAQRRHSE